VANGATITRMSRHNLSKDAANAGATVVRILGIVALGAALAGCATERAPVAEDARLQLVGMSKEQILACMGPPAGKAVESLTEVWSYNTGDGTVVASGATSSGTYSGTSSSRFCKIEVVFAPATVITVNYFGPAGGLPTASEQCASALSACVKKR